MEINEWKQNLYLITYKNIEWRFRGSTSVSSLQLPVISQVVNVAGPSPQMMILTGQDTVGKLQQIRQGQLAITQAKTVLAKIYQTN